MVESAWIESNFRVVILDGRAYMERHKKGHTSRELFTLWGILQLLRRYPGKLPDLDLMFSIADQSAIKVADYSGPNATIAPPPLFRYCGTDDTLEIVFPDWSFWGWAELHIKSWEGFLEELKGDKRWMDKEAYAHWKGTPLSPDRRDLLKCNISDKLDWGARLYKLAEDIVKAASDFVHEDLKMDYVYDYMFHVLSEYSKLMRYKPTIPKKAREICSETLACKATELHKKYLRESMVKGPTDVRPCNMPRPYDPHAFRTLLRSKANSKNHGPITQIDIAINGGVLLDWVRGGVGLVGAEVAHEGQGLEMVVGLVCGLGLRRKRVAGWQRWKMRDGPFLGVYIFLLSDG
ncbi:hypothetical protein RHSIM_RhsimUnG0069200 [Rhododendron simsii]|uniref:Glycosyl transferase CAP10 domain-containing protein n=1 Tax=Rhododendron simsii TaxID=118357 RepID=A0A834FW17_RHOSS|nr:hypothetical protein RHSIM_RhsimUnG0069200 [Rhododendron simsii]